MILDAYRRLVLTIIWSPIDPILPILEKFFNNPDKDEQFTLISGQFSLNDVYEGYPPTGDAHKKRVLLRSYGSNGEITILVANLQDGWQSLGYIISAKLHIPALVLAVHSHNDKFPANSFSMIRDGYDVRHVSARKEDKWIFYSEGEIQSFEDPSIYQKRIIKDRLPPEAIARIARKKGVDINSESFVLEKAEGIMFLS